jgi:hypothetical protein
MTQRQDMNVRDRPLKISKAEGASRQVEEAIKALERGDFDIAVTLAGAAEGMLAWEPWMWTLIFPHHEGRTPTHGYAATRHDRLREKLAAGVRALASRPAFFQKPLPGLLCNAAHFVSW